MHILLVLLGVCLLAAPPATASPAPVAAPLLQSWSDTGLITADDDWSRVPGVVGHRGDGLAAEPGVDPRTVTADGSGTPVDVTANRTDPRAVGLASGVAEFELADPVVAIQGSATASAPHLLISLDTRGRAGVWVRMVLRDIDASGADAVAPVAVQYRVGASGSFTPVPAGHVTDATSGPGEATLVTPVRTALPAAADGQALVQIRVITTNAGGQDEWIGVDDLEITASGTGPSGTTCPGPAPPPVPPPVSPPAARPLELTDLAVSPATFTPSRRGAAIVRRGGTGLRFRLSRAALVRFEVIRAGAAPEDLLLRPDAAARRSTPVPGGRFAARGRRGLNRLRFSGRLRGRSLANGTYTLRAVAVDRSGRESAPAATRFHVGRSWD